jgi:hypothetical protein
MQRNNNINNRNQAAKKAAAKSGRGKTPAAAMKAKAAATPVVEGDREEQKEEPKHTFWFKADLPGVNTFRQFEVNPNVVLLPDVGYVWRRVNKVNLTVEDVEGAMFYDEEGKPIEPPTDLLINSQRDVMHFKFNILDSLVGGMEQDFPKYKITRGKLNHSHGGLAATRRFYEMVIYEQLMNDYGRTVIDVGGSVRRHSRRRVHCLTPDLIPGDTKRNEEAIAILNQVGQTVTACNHKWKECTCLYAFGAPAMSIHSLYYLHDEFDDTFYSSPQYIYDCMVKFRHPVFIALHHALDSSYYEYLGVNNKKEGSYYRTSLVTMAVCNNSNVYQHKPLDWLSVASYRPFGAEYTLTWETTKLSCFDLRITTFRLKRGPMESIPRSIATSYDEVTKWDGTGLVINSASPVRSSVMRLINDSSLHNDTWAAYAYQLIAPVVNFVNRRLHLEFGIPIRVLKYGNLVIFGENNTAVIDVGLHEYLMGKVTILPKIDHNAIDHLIGLAKTYNKYNCIPAFASNRAIHNTVHFTLDRLLEEGTKFYTKINKQADQINNYNDLVARSLHSTPEETLPYFKIGMCVLVAGLTMYVYRGKIMRMLLATTEPIKYDHRQALFAIGLACVIKNYNQVADEVLDEPEATTAVCTRGAQVPEIGIDPEGNPLHVVDHVDMGVCRMMFGNLKMIGLRNRRAYICKPCVHNLYVGAMTRLLHRDDVRNDEWFKDNGNPVWRMLWGDNLNPTPFDSWVSRFPAPRRRMLTKANQQLINPSFEFEPTVREWFIKKENYVKGNDEGYEMIKPRIISGPNIHYLVQTGPISHAIGVRAKMVWNGVNTNILYTSGYNANELGKMFDKHIDQLGGVDNVIIIEGDASNFESSVKINQYLFVRQLLIRMGVDKDHITLLDHQWQTNRFKTVDQYGNMLKVNFSAIRHSGDGLTSFGNSVVNVKSIHMVFDNEVLKGAIIWVLGDDNMIMLRRDAWAKMCVNLQQIIERFKDIGFEMKLVLSDPYTVSYCSGSFYPTDKGTIWGPKISRVMTRTFTCHHNYLRLGFDYYKEWLIQVATGLRLDVNFIPGLRVIVKRLLNLTSPGVQLPRQYIIDFEREHKLHNTVLAEPTVKTYEMLYANYQMTKFDFDSLEQYLNDSKLGPNLEHYVFDSIVEKDVPIIPKFDGVPAEYGVLGYHAITRMLSEQRWESPMWFGSALFDAHGELVELPGLNKDEVWNQITMMFPQSIMINYFFYVICIAPCYEEGIKEMLINYGGLTGLQAGWLFGVLEFAFKYHTCTKAGMHPSGLIPALPTILAHAYVYRGSYSQRVLKHSAWNFMCSSPFFLAVAIWWVASKFD